MDAPLTPEEMSELMLDVAANRASRLVEPRHVTFRKQHEAWLKTLPAGAIVEVPHDFPEPVKD